MIPWTTERVDSQVAESVYTPAEDALYDAIESARRDCEQNGVSPVLDWEANDAMNVVLILEDGTRVRGTLKCQIEWEKI